MTSPGTVHYERLSVTACQGRVVFSHVLGDSGLTQCLLTDGSSTSFQVWEREDVRVRQLSLCTDLPHSHLLLVTGVAVHVITFTELSHTGEITDQNSWTIVFYNTSTMSVIKTIPAPEVEGPRMNLEVKFFRGGIYIESLMTAEDDVR